MKDSDLSNYYRQVMIQGKLRTIDHARRWSYGVLNTLGTSLDRKTKMALADELPEELARSLKGVFWLLHFRDPAMTSVEFQQRAARRSGNSDAEFARYPIEAVFGGLKQYLNDSLDTRVGDALPGEVRELWLQADLVETSA